MRLRGTLIERVYVQLVLTTIFRNRCISRIEGNAKDSIYDRFTVPTFIAVDV